MIEKSRFIKVYEFQFDASPHGKERPRVARNRRVYTPEKTVKYEGYVQAETLKQLKKFPKTPPLLGPVAVVMVFAFDVPDSYSAKKKSGCFKMEVLHTKRPDIDNLQKSVLDAMNKIVFQDDSQVCYVESHKIFSAGKPFVKVTVYEIL